MAKVEAVAGRRYSKALWDSLRGESAQEENSIHNETRAMSALLNAWQESVDLKSLSKDPSVSIKQKEAVMSALGERIGAGKTLQQFLKVLVRAGRLELFPVVAEGFLRLELESRGQGVAQVESAYELDSEQLSKIEKFLVKRFKIQPQMRVGVKPELIAGVRIHFNGQTVEQNILNKTENLQKELAAKEF